MVKSSVKSAENYRVFRKSFFDDVMDRPDVYKISMVRIEIRRTFEWMSLNVSYIEMYSALLCSMCGSVKDKVMKVHIM